MRKGQKIKFVSNHKVYKGVYISQSSWDEMITVKVGTEIIKIFVSQIVRKQ